MLSSELVEDIAILCEADMADTIREVVAALPKDVAEWVVQNVTFVDISGARGLACHVPLNFPSDHRCDAPFGGIRLMIIVQRCDDDTEADRRFLVAHEIAHHVCGHFEGSAKTPAEFERQEEAADRLANEWGFAGKGNRERI